jgi:hypothetical protein
MAKERPVDWPPEFDSILDQTLAIKKAGKIQQSLSYLIGGAYCALSHFDRPLTTAPLQKLAGNIAAGTRITAASQLTLGLQRTGHIEAVSAGGRGRRPTQYSVTGDLALWGRAHNELTRYLLKTIGVQADTQTVLSTFTSARHLPSVTTYEEAAELCRQQGTPMHPETVAHLGMAGIGEVSQEGITLRAREQAMLQNRAKPHGLTDSLFVK